MPSPVPTPGGDRSTMLPLITARSGVDGHSQLKPKTENERKGEVAPDSRPGDPAIKHIIPRSEGRSRMT